MWLDDCIVAGEVPEEFILDSKMYKGWGDILEGNIMAAMLDLGPQEIHQVP